MYEDIAERLAEVRGKIADSERAAGRPAGSAALVAVSKFHPAEAVRAAYRAGQHLFGENRVQEGAAKFAEVKAAYPEAALHLIGPLQRNKVAKAVEAAVMLEAVDRLEVLEEAAKAGAKQGKRVAVLLELHTGEESKGGFPDGDSVFRALEAALRLPTVEVRGLMTMAPFTKDEALIRRSFRLLRETLEAARIRFPQLPLRELSMGMSNDYPLAIEEGSTLLRVGTALFGERQP
jgi:pyridoxal phosphate enzyme (YggS family)